AGAPLRRHAREGERDLGGRGRAILPGRRRSVAAPFRCRHAPRFGAGSMNDWVKTLFEELPDPDDDARRAVAERAAMVLRPAGALARLDEIAVWLAGWQRTERPTVEAPAIVVFVADHGVAREGVSAYPAAVTAAML